MRFRLNGSFLGCASGLFAMTFVGTSTEARAQTVSSVLWMSTECEAAPPKQTEANESLSGAILGIVLGPLIEAGVKGLGDAIAKAGAPSDIRGVGTLSTDLYAVDVPWNPTKPTQPTLRFARKCLIAAFGPRVENGASPAGFGRLLRYEGSQIYYNDIDTYGGSSGSGIRDRQGAIIGVHTNGGCDAPRGANRGVSIGAIRNVSGRL